MPCGQGGGDLAISFCNAGASFKVSVSDELLSDYVPSPSGHTLGGPGRPGDAAVGGFTATPDISAFLSHVPGQVSAYINQDVPLLHVHLAHFADGGSLLALAFLHTYCDAMSVQMLVEVWADGCDGHPQGSSGESDEPGEVSAFGRCEWGTVVGELLKHQSLHGLQISAT